METLTKLQIAERQLDSAIRRLLDDEDPVSAITLAGASEEILGKLLERSGRKHSLAEFVEACVKTGHVVFGEEWPPKLFVELENHFRDGLKHITDGAPMSIPREAAESIIDRAIDNYWALTGSETAEVRRFMEKVHGI